MRTRALIGCCTTGICEVNSRPGTEVANARLARSENTTGMLFRQCTVAGAWLIEPTPHEDQRGRFMRAWCAREFHEHGIDFAPLQANMGFSRKKGTIRGMHYQVAPALEAKLVRCTRGALFDVVLDLRRESSTYLRWHGVHLTPENGRMLYAPEGCAHGCQALADDTEFHYMASVAFSPEHATGVRYDDPTFAIEWPEAVTLVSEQDRQWPLLGKTAVTGAREKSS
jgi:dTDP-4-dehydrorhamnose 3,5-epimerase